MNPSKVDRNRLTCLTDLPNVGPAMAADLELLGVHEPSQLRDRDPYEMYDSLCRIMGTRMDPCVIDLFVSVTRFMCGGDARPWWEFTDERKRTLHERTATGRTGCRGEG